MFTSSVLAVALVLAPPVPEAVRLEREIDLPQLYRLLAEVTQEVAGIRQQIVDLGMRLTRHAVEAKRAQLEFALRAENAAVDIARVRLQAIRITLSTAPINSTEYAAARRDQPRLQEEALGAAKRVSEVQEQMRRLGMPQK
jgi:hypothetical protein